MPSTTPLPMRPSTATAAPGVFAAPAPQVFQGAPGSLLGKRPRLGTTADGAGPLTAAAGAVMARTPLGPASLLAAPTPLRDPGAVPMTTFGGGTGARPSGLGAWAAPHDQENIVGMLAERGGRISELESEVNNLRAESGSLRAELLKSAEKVRRAEGEATGSRARAEAVAEQKARELEELSAALQTEYKRAAALQQENARVRSERKAEREQTDSLVARTEGEMTAVERRTRELEVRCERVQHSHILLPFPQVPVHYRRGP